MSRKWLSAYLFAVLMLVAALPAFGWDETGHKITAYIAWQQMTPQTRENVIKILRAAPEDAQLSTFYMGYGGRSDEARKREFFMIVATWADIIRDRDFETRMKKYHHSNWHYSDIFWKTLDGKIVDLPAPDEGGKALEKLIDFDKSIRGSDSDKEKALAIAWLEHLIGDLHQPLHTSARVTDLEPKGDQGGNFFKITPKDTPRDKEENLHWFWDSIIVRAIPRKNDACDADYLDPIAKSIMKKYPYAKMQSRLQPGKFEIWKAESLKAAQEQVFSADLKRFETPSAAYKKKALAVAEERLALAGYRMGELFNEVFGAKPAAPAATASGSIPCQMIR
ncbi:MAG TPA: S1/P1 nuclease, partial [Nitrosospira sp.]|nr:S1/P1 nuclease [Nitrosospira sp.]